MCNLPANTYQKTMQRSCLPDSIHVQKTWQIPEHFGPCWEVRCWNNAFFLLHKVPPNETDFPALFLADLELNIDTKRCAIKSVKLVFGMLCKVW